MLHHGRNEYTQLLRAPPDTGTPTRGAASLLSWAVPAALLLGGGLAGGEASGLVAPDAPALIAGGAVGFAAAAAVSREVLVPLLSRLPARGLSGESVKQEFLAEYCDMQAKMALVTAELEADVAYLSRLWQVGVRWTVRNQGMRAQATPSSIPSRSTHALPPHATRIPTP